MHQKQYKLPPDLFEKDVYMFIPQDVASFFTNLPLKKTVYIINKRVYNE